MLVFVDVGVPLDSLREETSVLSPKELEDMQLATKEPLH